MPDSALYGGGRREECMFPGSATHKHDLGIRKVSQHRPHPRGSELIGPAFLNGTLAQVTPTVVRGRAAGEPSLSQENREKGRAWCGARPLQEAQGRRLRCPAHGLLPRNAVFCGGRTAGTMSLPCPWDRPFLRALQTQLGAEQGPPARGLSSFCL